MTVSQAQKDSRFLPRCANVPSAPRGKFRSTFWPFADSLHAGFVAEERP